MRVERDRTETGAEPWPRPSPLRRRNRLRRFKVAPENGSTAPLQGSLPPGESQPPAPALPAAAVPGVPAAARVSGHLVTIAGPAFPPAAPPPGAPGTP